MMSICYKEKLKISPDILSSIIASTDNDIRLTLNHLSIFAAGNDNLNTNKKYVKMVLFYYVFYVYLYYLYNFVSLGSMGCYSKSFFCTRSCINEYK